MSLTGLLADRVEHWNIEHWNIEHWNIEHWNIERWNSIKVRCSNRRIGALLQRIKQAVEFGQGFGVRNFPVFTTQHGSSSLQAVILIDGTRDYMGGKNLLITLFQGCTVKTMYKACKMAM